MLKIFNKKNIVSFFLAFNVMFFGFSSTASALNASWWPLVPCGLNAPPIKNGTPVPGYTNPCNKCDLFKLIKNVLDFFVEGVMPVGGAILFTSAGLLYITSSAMPGNIAKANKIFKDTSIGILIICASWLITNTLIINLAPKSQDGKPWFSYQCVATVRTPNPLGTTIVTTTSTPITIGGSKTPAPTSATNLCQGTQTSCSNSSCSQYVSSINKYASQTGVPSSLIKAIMFNESSCNYNPPSSGAGAYGLMQIKPETANQFKSRCGVSENITSGWLTSSRNSDAIICIGAEYLKSISSGVCGSSPRNVAAGYNGGTVACERSVSCSGDLSCDGTATKKWECLYDNPAKTVPNTGYEETRKYAPKVAYCASNPGF
jgi:hypothetical protein